MYHDYNEHSSLEIGVFTVPTQLTSWDTTSYHSHASVVFLFFSDESWNFLVNPAMISIRPEKTCLSN